MAENAKFTKDVKVVHLESESQKVMRARLARLPAAVHVLHEKAKHLISQKLKSFFDKADDSLFELADKAHSNQEQNLYFDSMREVRVQRRGIEKRFSAAIDAAFANLVVKKPTEPGEFYGDSLSAEALSLVQNEDLEEMVAVESSVSRANAEFGEAIQQISLRLDSLVPVKVYQKNNPVGPDVLCSAFMVEVKKLDVDIKAKLVLFKLFDRTVVASLGEVYAAANQMLIEHNVLPSLIAGAGAESRYHESSDSPEASPVADNPAVDKEVLVALKGILDGQVIRSEQNSDGQQLLRLLSAAQKSQSHQVQSSEGVNVKRLLGNLQSQTDGVQIGRIDDEIMNLVNMLFEFILEDRNLAGPMKSLISRMQIPLIKVALVDKAFFAKGGHSARRLLNEMATAALGWEGDIETCGRDPLYKKMENIVRSLIEEFDTDVSIFSDLLADFTSFVEKEKRRVAVLERRTLDAEDGKAKAEVARKIVGVEIELRTINEALPDVVHKLIDNAWQNVLFVIGLKHGYNSKEWALALKTMEDLVWSAQVPSSEKDRQKLIRLVPDLLRRLRGGLDAISFNPFVMSELFKSLEGVHLACIRGKPLVAPKREKPTTRRPHALAKEPQETKVEKASSAVTQTKQAKTPDKVEKRVESTAVTPASKRATHNAPVEPKIKESQVLPESKPVVQSDVAVNDAENDSEPKKSEPLQSDDPHMKLVNGFVQGAWFEMIDDTGASIRCRLAAVIKPTGKYIFVNRNGMKVAEKTQQELAQSLKDERIRALDNSMLFDRALETVVSSLRKSH